MSRKKGTITYPFEIMTRVYCLLVLLNNVIFFVAACDEYIRNINIEVGIHIILLSGVLIQKHYYHDAKMNNFKISPVL